MNQQNNDEVLPPGVSLTEPSPVRGDANILMTINLRVLDTLKRYDLNINQLFVLLAMYDDAIGLLDLYDDDFSKRKILVEDYQHLHVHGFISIPAEGTGPLYQLDDKGKVFVEQIRVLFEMPNDEKQEAADIKELAAEYLELWPKIKLPSGVYARVSIVEIEKKLKSFVKLYRIPLKKQYDIKLDRQIIMAAAKGYIARFAKQNYNFMVNSSYFIQKKEKSTLADEIIAMKQGTIKTEDKWLKQL